MIQEKPTALRILQSNKKKPLSPVIYLFIGFVSGIVFSLFAVFLFFKTQTNPDLNNMTSPEEPSISPVTKGNTRDLDTIELIHQESSEAIDDNNFAQPQSSELNKFFQHAPLPATDSQQRISPFANEPNVKPDQPTAKVENSKKRNSIY